jgi:ADP-ribose pyrophosphatase YjhB (NUDIX family)
MSDRAYPSRPLLAASVAVIREGHILLASRARPPAQGLFSLPGGLVEPGETLEEAALRELNEEVAVAASIIGFNDHVEVIERDAEGRVARHFVIASFVARWLSGEGTPSAEAQQVIWVRPGAVEGLRTTQGLPRIVARAFRVIEASALAGKVHRDLM